ncbi:hypothetical protein QA942_19875 [Streptomyces sp. B21-106]|uniref:hypothetical protein n=1 Tax=Streptomyces sp. B21-106 TaxID=3039418 RepID=UPI002FF3830D
MLLRRGLGLLHRSRPRRTRRPCLRPPDRRREELRVVAAQFVDRRFQAGHGAVVVDVQGVGVDQLQESLQPRLALLSRGLRLGVLLVLEERERSGFDECGAGRGLDERCPVAAFAFLAGLAQRLLVLGLVAAGLVLQLLVAEPVAFGVVVGLLQRGLRLCPLCLRRWRVVVVGLRLRLLGRRLGLRCLVGLRLFVRLRLGLVVDFDLDVGLVVGLGSAGDDVDRPAVSAVAEDRARGRLIASGWLVLGWMPICSSITGVVFGRPSRGPGSMR